MKGKQMSKKRIEEVISETLKDGAQKNALDFVRFLREKEIPLEESDNYWEVKYRDKGICFMWIDGTDNKPGPWTIWSNGDYDNFLVDDHIKELAWANINPCGSCGEACSPGSSKMVFEKKYE